MKQVSWFSKKQILLTALLVVSVSGIGHASTYTSIATSGTAWDGAWSPSSPVSKAVDGSVNTYTFFGGNSYVGNDKLVGLIADSNTTTVRLVSDGAAISFDNWNVGGSNSVVYGKSVELGDNISFNNTTGVAIIAIGGVVTVGNNVTVNSSTNLTYGHYGAGISIIGKGGKSTFGENFTASNNFFRDSTNLSPFIGGGAIGMRYTMDLEFANNAVFENNKVQSAAGLSVAMGGAISGPGNEIDVNGLNNITFNGSASFLNNSAVSTGAGSFARGGAIATVRASGTPLKLATVTFNSLGGTVNLTGNGVQSAGSSGGGAIYIGDGEIYRSR